jgi:hypothetical protein
MSASITVESILTARGRNRFSLVALTISASKAQGQQERRIERRGARGSCCR